MKEVALSIALPEAWVRPKRGERDPDSTTLFAICLAVELVLTAFLLFRLAAVPSLGAP